MLTMLPALLAIFGRNAFWSPFFDTIPHVGQQGADETHGRWRRIGEWVAAHSRRVWVGGTLVLVLLALNVTQIDTGLTNSNSFRGNVESVEGADILARSFPGGLGGVTNVIVPDGAKANAVKTALEKRRDLVAQVLPPQEGPPGTRLDVVLRGDPFATSTFDQVPALRRTVKAAGGSDVLVGGPTAEAYDYRKSATRDNFVVLPLALIVVLVILAILLRSLLAPVLLVASVILSFFAALGTGIFFFEHVFGFAGVDPSLPLLTFVFLVALGIDYNIFLMARVREETLTHGTHQGMLRGLAVTGAVITSAGIVLAGTFSALAVLPLVFLTEIGFIIAFGVLLDTFLVRSVLVPALAFDIGPKIWWPSKLAHEDGPAEGAEVGARAAPGMASSG
jgi:RND superfamily putative drug exporter